MVSPTHTLTTERNGVGVKAQRTINWEGDDIGEVMFYAKDLRQERTGLHASIQAFYNNELLAWTTCNIERDEDRVRFSGSVARRLEMLSRNVNSRDKCLPQGIYQGGSGLLCVYSMASIHDRLCL